VVTLGSVAQMVEDDARLNASKLRVRINRCQGTHVLREVKDDGHIGALAGEACACAARQHRGSSGSAGGKSCFHIISISWNHDAYRKLAVVGGVGGVERSRTEVEADLSAKSGLKASVEFAMGGEALMV